MYPAREKSALPKKEIQVLRSLVNPTEEEVEIESLGLLELSLKKALRRVVIKRPTWAEPLLAEPKARFESKLVRFDLYVP